MDPITTAIITAISKLAEPAVKDSYEALKRAIAKKLGHSGEVASAVRELEAKPNSDARKGDLAERVVRTGAALDEELLQLAAEILETAKSSRGEVHVVQNVGGSGNVFSGTGDVHVERMG